MENFGSLNLSFVVLIGGILAFNSSTVIAANACLAAICAGVKVGATAGFAVSSCATVLLLATVLIFLTGVLFCSAVTGVALAIVNPPVWRSDMSEESLAGSKLLPTNPSESCLVVFSELTRRDLEVFSLSPSTSIFSFPRSTVEESLFLPLTTTGFTGVLSTLAVCSGVDFEREFEVGVVKTTMAGLDVAVDIATGTLVPGIATCVGVKEVVLLIELFKESFDTMEIGMAETFDEVVPKVIVGNEDFASVTGIVRTAVAANDTGMVHFGDGVIAVGAEGVMTAVV